MGARLGSLSIYSNTGFFFFTVWTKLDKALNQGKSGGAFPAVVPELWAPTGKCRVTQNIALKWLNFQNILCSPFFRKSICQYYDGSDRDRSGDTLTVMHPNIGKIIK